MRGEIEEMDMNIVVGSVSDEDRIKELKRELDGFLPRWAYTDCEWNRVVFDKQRISKELDRLKRSVIGKKL